MEWIVHLPRIARIAVCALFGIAMTGLLTPLVDRVYLDYFFNADTVILPALISAVAGVLVYGVGWRVFVGYAGERPRYNRALLLYLAFGVFVTVFALTLFFVGIIRR